MKCNVSRKLPPKTPEELAYDRSRCAMINRKKAEADLRNMVRERIYGKLIDAMFETTEEENHGKQP